jgi:homoserine kinase
MSMRPPPHSAWPDQEASMAARPAFRAAPVTITVPATSANLGSGFDSMALAYDLHDVLAAQILDEPGLDIEIAGEGSEDLRRDAKHLVVRSMYAAFDVMGGRPRGIALRCANAIPQSRGLGSSAAAIVGGMVLARAMVLGGAERLDDEHLIALATEMEGHPDNVSAALLGGAVISWMEGGRGRAVRMEVHPSVSATLFIPTTSASTSKARKALPDAVPFADAVTNLSRAALLTQALTVDPSLLFTATEDRLHQEYRRSVIPRSLSLVGKLRADGHAAVVSGAGPTVLVLHQAPFDPAPYAGASFEPRAVGISSVGAALA